MVIYFSGKEAIHESWERIQINLTEILGSAATGSEQQWNIRLLLIESLIENVHKCGSNWSSRNNNARDNYCPPFDETHRMLDESRGYSTRSRTVNQNGKIFYLW